MGKWEFAQVVANGPDFMGRLNILGKDGWELVSVVQQELSVPRPDPSVPPKTMLKVIAYLKRPLR